MPRTPATVGPRVAATAPFAAAVAMSASLTEPLPTAAPTKPPATVPTPAGAPAKLSPVEVAADAIEPARPPSPPEGPVAVLAVPPCASLWLWELPSLAPPLNGSVSTCNTSAPVSVGASAASREIPCACSGLPSYLGTSPLHKSLIPKLYLV